RAGMAGLPGGCQCADGPEDEFDQKARRSPSAVSPARPAPRRSFTPTIVLRLHDERRASRG
ncbi:hypothetical protein ABTF88_20600, partial [Acinetobacter baumannii]